LAFVTDRSGGGQRHTQSKDHEAQIHWIAGELVGTASNQSTIGGRSWVDFGTLTTKQNKSPDGCDERNRHQSYAERRSRQTRGVGQSSNQLTVADKII
jgi:hypothetical protein